ncbi:peptide chain release factor N(5)-glutamine methyltransferase [Qipengyuania spongiae]|uniref:Release factor glutamine methyltransferase n=1 Tax=Qipengyuania spongiae TaxID=2909673 RepID=A0ABY5SYW9_9SPHN|nr:peptide chain release factor N(5)-glutamine methyltransferase [Qipengyuania spongiae]UVI39737.1 peptide chain release factor N(5)-glutamine methyltransferase [Qipengyuania spongiae]
MDATVGDALRESADRLAVEWGRLDAELLMAHAFGVSRSDLLLRHLRDPVPAGFAALLARRIAHEPMAYILGHAEFYGRRFRVTPATLIPRGDSEVLIEAALTAKPAPARVLDLGTGTGALLLTVLAETGAEGIGVDASEAALAVARENATVLDLDARVEMRLRDWTQADWADGLGQFDLVLCNPPYVEDDAELDPSVREHEPASALFAGPDGLDDYRVLMPQLEALLAPDGVAVFEIGHRQAGAVGDLARAAGFAARLERDLAGRPRALVLACAANE